MQWRLRRVRGGRGPGVGAGRTGMKNGGSNDRGKGTVTLTLGLPQFGMKFRLDVVFFFFSKGALAVGN